MKKQIRNLLVLTSLTAISIHFMNRFISISSTVKNLLKTEYGKFYDWKYGKIFYSKMGKGSPVLLLHDLDPASSSLEWNRISKSLSKKHTVYSIDLLGCGRSDKPNLTYTNFLYVQLITDFIKDVIHEKANLIASGSSCSFSIMSCNMDPEYFKKIILVNPEQLSDLAKTPSKRKNALKFLIDLPIIGTMFYNILYSKYGIKQYFSEHYSNANQVVLEKLIDSYYEAAHLKNGNGKYLLSSIHAYYTNINIIHALKKVNNSIFIIGSKENETETDIIKDYANFNPSIETAVVDHSKYLPQLENPDKFLSHVELFLNTR